jgi:outer membrane receptor protein involved in Fe transport
MLNKIKLIMMLFLSLLFAECSSQNSTIINITNPTDLNLKDALIETSIDTKLQNISLLSDGEEIQFQLVDEDGKRILKFVTDLNSNQKKEIRLDETTSKKSNEFMSRTYAELSMKTNNVYFEKRFRGNKFENVNYLKVPAIHTDHDALFKYEGPGWESEKVGYRFYLDWRNATDIFGKKKNQLILDQVGIHDTVAKDDSYHSMQDWGMDIFKVGSSLGIGSIGMWAEDKVNMVSKTDSVICSIPYTGPIEAKVNTKYYGWQVGDNKYYLNSSFSISAGSRLTKCELEISNNAENIVTGLAKYDKTELIKSNNKSGWNYLTLYGNQTLVNENDKLGIVVFYDSNDLIELTEDKLSYIIKLKPKEGKVTYYFAAAWEQEENGIKNIDDFKKYLDETLLTLNNPVIVEIK